jgi:hypothetical protein
MIGRAAKGVLRKDNAVAAIDGRKNGRKHADIGFATRDDQRVDVFLR